jgi:Cytochrome c554 and c-prime
MKTACATALLLTAGGVGFAPGCGSDGTAPPTKADGGALAFDGSLQADATALLDPSVCRECHANHYNDWAGSMHAYASQDPVFLAMNKRMQRENPSLGTFCVKCHAPMAVIAGKTTDGLNLASLSPGYLGVTCYFCHTIASVDSAHPFNAGVTLAGDRVMRGEISKPVANTAHDAAYSPYQDQSKPESASMCGACHDIVSPAKGHIERTFAEWQASPFSGETDASQGVTTCAASGCHMVQQSQLKPIVTIQTPDGGSFPDRVNTDHDFPAVDQALTSFPNAATEQAAVVLKLTNALQGALCVTRGSGRIGVILDTVSLGHDFPSGAAQDRRLWTEVIARDQGGNVIYQSGVVPDGTSPTAVGPSDPDLWLLRDCMFDTQGDLVDMFWQGATTDGNELPPIQAFFPSPLAYASHKVRFFPESGGPLTNDAGAPQMPASVTLRVRLQPIGLDVLNDLVSTGDLDANVVSALPPPIDIPLGFGTPTTLTWTAEAAADGGVMSFNDNGNLATCVGSLSIPSPSPAAAHMNPKCTP